MKGVLLVNLGSPDSPTPKDVKKYLGEFLMDERVIDVPKWARTLLVKGIILNTRPKVSAKAYSKIWWKEGSPLIVLSERLENKLSKEVEVNIQSLLKKPHKLEYEKCFWPFMLISKKRYVGRKFEEDPDKSYINSMGVVSKRRDNAKIVKHIYGGILDIIMNKYDIELSKKFLREELLKLANGEFPLEELIITKSLRGYYKDPDRIAHKVLADRIGERDPGNKPGSNDRIPYIYIEKKESRTRVILQGERIENPDFIKENKLRPDYRFYITNQIKKPVSQIYALVMDNPDKLFEESLRLIDNNRNRVKPITSWFTQVNPNDITSL